MNDRSPSGAPGPSQAGPSQAGPSQAGSSQAGPRQLVSSQPPSSQVVRSQVLAEVAKHYVGTPETTELLLIALLAGGHVLLEGVPGIAKTTLVKAFSEALGCQHRRIQFTPDLLPGDITGGYILNMKTQEFELRSGPVFTQILLADEINRAPAKTQSALLEAMQEGHVTIEGEGHELPAPFMVLATQNPVEQAGVYPLPEAQVDRFLFRLMLPYPSFAQEREMLVTWGGRPEQIEARLTAQDILALQRQAEAVFIDPSLLDWIVKLVQVTRHHKDIALGASPRASLALMRSAKARALLHGREMVLPDDIKQLYLPVLNHRVLLSPEASYAWASPAPILEACLRKIPYAGPGTP